jgi:outer membrane protein insertion porin family
MNGGYTNMITGIPHPCTWLCRGMQSGNLKVNKGMICIILVLLISGSCTGLRHLDEDQVLYTGSRISVEPVDAPIPNKGEVESELETVIRPDPNTRILISRPRLWIHNIMGETGERGIDHWIQTNLGRPPVLFEDVDTERTARLMQNRLFNMGYFDAEVDYQLRERTKRTSVDYRISVKPPYRIRNIIEPEGDIPIIGEIGLAMQESILESGRIYRLQSLRDERDRIDQYLKERGYFYFHPDYLIFIADTTAGDRMVDLYLRIKPAAPPMALDSYTIRNVYIDTGSRETVDFEDTGQESVKSEDTGQGIAGFEEYAPETGMSVEPSQQSGNFEEPGLVPPAVIKEGVYIISGEDYLKPHVLHRAVFLEQGQLYTNRDRRRTLSYLMGLEIFRFVNLRFNPVVNNAGNSYLDARIMLVPLERRAVTTELRGVSKSNDFAGPGITGTYLNRNLLGGAEQLRISIEGAFETLLGETGVNSIEAGITSELRIPRLMPFEIGWMTPELIPSTRMSLSLNYLNRTDAFSLASFRSEFGYLWNPSIRTQQRLTPFVFNVFGLGSVAPEYEELFDRDALLRRGLFEQFILGSQYSYLYNSQLDGISNEDWYFNLNLDVAGNSLWMATNYLGIGGADDEGGRQILGQSFSQYGKADFDFRYYVNIGSDTRLATRFIAGIGVPYGNSTTLPYTKLFTIGGTQSIRAFHPRRLGPGSYTPPEELETAFNIYQAGEIKLEMNVEFRYALSNIIKGAIFADAGNIWNLQEDEDVPGGRFEYPGFLQEIALGTGMGLRLDFTFFLLRLDLAFPLFDPRDAAGDYFQPVRPLDSRWRRDNLVFNLAIGYPF